MTRVVAVVQARMGSQRFPGKMLSQLGEHTLLDWVLQRVLRSTQVDQVVLATSTNSEDDKLVSAALRLEVDSIRGSETDVLSRFLLAADNSQADLVVRVCADNPFIAPEELDRLIVDHRAKNVDYSCNHQQKLSNKYADGFGAEILSHDLLKKLANQTTQQPHREHVTSYIWDNQKEFKINAVTAPAELAFPEVKLDIDTPAELAVLNEFVRQYSVKIETKAAEIVESFRKFSAET
jgi:spore coat polysaccharide biosynthesis protein SpsF